MHVWRRTTKTTYRHAVEAHEDQLCDEAVLKKFSLMATLAIIKLHGLNLFMRLASGKNSVAKASAFAAKDSQKGWFAAVTADFEWVKLVDATCKAPCLGTVQSIAEWIPLLKSRIRWWKLKIWDLCRIDEANRIEEAATEGATCAIGDVFECEICQKVQPTLQQLGLHQFREHGIKREARRFIGPLVNCPACFRIYPTRTQAIRHLYSAPKCKGYDQLCVELPEDMVNELDTMETKRLQKAAASNAYDTCNLRCAENLCGPLRKEFVQCYKGRPKYHPVIDDHG